MAICGVIADYSDGLEVGVDDGGSDECESAFFEVFGNFI